jgi:hypothetical protein
MVYTIEKNDTASTIVIEVMCFSFSGNGDCLLHN